MSTQKQKQSKPIKEFSFAKFLQIYRWISGDDEMPSICLDAELEKEPLEKIAEVMFPCPKTISSKRDIRQFLAHVVYYKKLGIAFHPDTDFDDYVIIDVDKHEQYGQKCFTEEEIYKFESLISDCGAYLLTESEDIYQMTSDLWSIIALPTL